MWSVQALESNLTPEEQLRILDAIEGGKKVKARPDASLSQLRKVPADMEKAAGLIARAMLRP